MDSFDQLIELSHEARDVFKKFMDQNFDMSVDQAFLNYHKAHEICKDIQNRMDKVEMRKEGSGYGYDLCVYYMAQDWLNKYQYATLVVLTNKLGENMLRMAKETAENKQKESLKTLIKEAVKEAKVEELKSKRVKTKQRDFD